MKMLRATPQQIEQFYPSSEEWYRSTGEKLLKAYRELGIDPKSKIGTDNPVEAGKKIKKVLSAT